MQTKHGTLCLEDGRKAILRSLNDPELEKIERLLLKNASKHFSIMFALGHGATVFSTTVNGEEIHLIASPTGLLEKSLKAALRADTLKTHCRVSGKTLEKIFKPVAMVVYAEKIYPTRDWKLRLKTTYAKSLNATLKGFEKTPFKKLFLNSIKNNLSPAVECLLEESENESL